MKCLTMKIVTNELNYNNRFVLLDDQNVNFLCPNFIMDHMYKITCEAVAKFNFYFNRILI